MADNSLDSLLARLNTAELQANPKTLAAQLTAFAKREDGPAILRGGLHDGSDPLVVVPPAAMTLQYLFILTTRLTVTGSEPVQPDHILGFTRLFNPIHARCAPERISMLARAIVRYGENAHNPVFPLEPLHNLLTAYPPSLSYLTTIHPLFLASIVETRNFAAAVPILETPITQVDKTVSDLEYTDVLQYYYLGGVAFAALRRFDKAEEFLETAVSSPAHVPSAIQLEAFKKLTLIQLIRHGRTLSMPKYTNGALIKQMKNIPQYAAIVKHYPTIKGPITELLTKEGAFFTEEGNLGLIRIVIDYGSRWALKGLMKTYSSLSVTQVAKLIHLPNEQVAQEIITSMITSGELAATLSSTGVLEFHEDVIDAQAIAPQAIQDLLTKAQLDGLELEQLQRSMVASKALLQKALKEKESPYERGGGAMGDEDWPSEQIVMESLFD
ncbi:hypothetical protein DL93DRAFT_2134487 [Clavulina sp. PMI_390]|nr:hypothetical protein DL93DRAFT_2134487 [Clavulina sp. PMI_390]